MPSPVACSQAVSRTVSTCMVHVVELGSWLRQAAPWAWPSEGLLLEMSPLQVLLTNAR